MSKEKFVHVKFEPAGWRTTGEAKAPLSIKEAHERAVKGVLRFLGENNILGAVYPNGRDLKSNEGYQFVHALIEGDEIKNLEKQGFVDREYPDQTRSTLRVLSRV